MRTIGNRESSAIGLGCMHMSIEGRPERSRAIRTIHAALDAGVTLLDTADAYHRDRGEVGHNEELIAEALATYGSSTDDIIVATKGGHRRPGDGTWTLHGGKDDLRRAASESRARLKMDVIPLYQFHRADPNVDYRESLESLADIVDDGIASAVGISNADVDQIALAHDILGNRLVSVQNHFSPRFRSSEIELRLCTELGIAFLAYRPLGRPHPADPGTERAYAYGQLAAKYGVSEQQVCLAWELALSPCVIPIPGARRPETITDSANAMQLKLDHGDVERLSAL